MAQSQRLIVIGKDGGLSTLRPSCGFACQPRVLKMFPGPGHLLYEDGVVQLRHFLVNLYMYSSPFYLATVQSQCLAVIEMDGGLNPLCHSCRFVCHQKVLKTFPGPGYLGSEDVVV